MTRKFTPEQTAFLDSYLPLYQKVLSEPRRRGTMQKFTGECAAAFIVSFGQPAFVKGQANLKQIIYNWFRNATSPRGSELRKAKSSIQQTEDGSLYPASDVSSPVDPPLPGTSDSALLPSIISSSASAPPISHVRASPPHLATHRPPSQPPPAQQPPDPPARPCAATLLRIHDALLDPQCMPSQLALDLSSLCATHLPHTHPQNFVPLAAAVDMLVHASASGTDAHSPIRRYLAAASLLLANVSHAGATGPASAHRALFVAIRRAPPSLLVARVHAAALECASELQCVRMTQRPIGEAVDEAERAVQEEWETQLAFADMFVRDSAYASPVQECAAGACVLRSLAAITRRHESMHLAHTLSRPARRVSANEDELERNREKEGLGRRKWLKARLEEYERRAVTIRAGDEDTGATRDPQGTDEAWAVLMGAVDGARREIGIDQGDGQVAPESRRYSANGTIPAA